MSDFHERNGGETVATKKTATRTATKPADAAIIARAVRLERCRSSLWEFQKQRDPKFFKDSRPHLKRIADVLQGVFECKLLKPDGTPYRKLVLSIPPRHGKSYSIAGFNQWAYGQRHDTRIGVISYNDILTGRFSQGVRDQISEEKASPDQIVYSDIFPNVKLRYGDSARGIWALEGEYFSFLATSFGGTMTGIGFNIGIIDDPIKLPEEAHNDAFLDAQYAWYTDAFLSRLEEDAMVVIVMTRWATNDLAGRVMEDEPGEWLYVKMQTPTESGEMLCPELLSRKTYDARARLTSPEIMAANYQQMPVDIKGALYQEFATYEYIPRENANGQAIVPRRVCYVDTADTGADYLCAIAADVVEGEGYVLDVVYTDEPMEATELRVAEMLYRLRALECVVESNNGGRGFARNVERILWERYHWRGTKIICKNQRDNKEARMLTAASFVERHIYYPADWRKRWREYALAMIRFQRKGKNAHDDAPDATTGLAEYIQGGLARRRKFFSGRGKR